MGEVFAGRYELLEPIASGGMGTVWRVVDQADGSVLAAKILRQSDAESLLRFVREQSMRIDHTHVVTPRSWAGVDDRVLFTMPLVRGGSVAELVREHGTLPVRWVAALTDQTLQALEAVHAAGIVHRDVKPGNLLLEPTGSGVPHLRLTDFGIAAPMDGPRMTHASVAIGTPGYMPPEQWHGADPDPRADLYAVGRVALEMPTGQRPRAGADPETVPQSLGDPARDALLAVITRACATAVGERPASAAAMRADLGALGLLSLPPTPYDVVFVPDRFGAAAADAPAAPTLRAGAPGPGPTLALRPDARTAAAGGHGTLVGALLVVGGLVGLALAVVLVLSA
ncbi:hypothetical protein BH11ACT8_BH11ACT8_33170 [soil metagenome]